MFNLTLTQSNTPTNKSLTDIESFQGDYTELFKTLQPYIGKYGICMQRNNLWQIVTGGRSEVECIIRALKRNELFWANHWRLHATGGLYEFDLADSPKDKEEYKSRCFLAL